VVTADITSGMTGTVRRNGVVSGLGALVVGATYYISTAGTITTVPPANARVVGQADTTTSLIVESPTLLAAMNPGVCQGRLTLTTGVPVTTADVTAATTIFFAPYLGAQVSLYDGTRWVQRQFAQLSVAVPATTSQMYDVFLFDNAGTLALELLAWTNDTTRATALVTQDGVLCKTAALTRRYLGSLRTTTVSGQTEDSATKRYVWNMYNRVARMLLRKESTASWTWATASWHQANAAAANQVAFVIGVNESVVDATVIGVGQQVAVTALSAGVAFGLDSTTTPAGIYGISAAWDNGGQAGGAICTGVYREYPGIGFHFLAWLEFGNTNTLTYFGVGAPTSSGGGSPTPQTGISGRLDG